MDLPECTRTVWLQWLLIRCSNVHVLLFVIVIEYRMLRIQIFETISILPFVQTCIITSINIILEFMRPCNNYIRVK